ncbi:DNA repair/transcription protein MET18/MMS19 [Candida viswanathii]|uniref:MMS19 nucleotide excision repair protein n=1 Tax=Candida viswanathii TaxID=5486 RepID=A0A367XMQ1_9ASCO|nr:DNA repair/transcription protein MET18/MMS19 [Candida viswanathii]
MVESEHNIPVLINQFIGTAGTDEAAADTYTTELSSLITSNQLTLLQFIQFLGASLTSATDGIRSKSVQCLSETVGKLDTGKLSRHDVAVLLDFYSVKIRDDTAASVGHALAGVRYLCGCAGFVSTYVEKVLGVLEREYAPKKHVAKVRHEAFVILKVMLERFREYLASRTQMIDMYVKTFLNVASGEKDPRNLLISFELNKRVNEWFTFDTRGNELHKQFVVDLFDVCFCYFPISFKPPPNDPYKITSEELKVKLRDAIASQSQYANDSFPSLIEKLTSTNPVIRNDTLKTLDLCVERYDASTVEEYWITLWNALKFEILHNEIDSVFKPTNDTIVPKNYEEIDDNDEFKPLVLTLVILNRVVLKLPQPEMMLQTVVEELKPHLTVIKDKSKKASLILSSLGSTSVENLNYVVDFVFQYDVWGKFLNIEKEDDHRKQEVQELDVSEDASLNIAKQRDLVDSIGFVLTAYQVLQPKGDTQLLEYKDYILIFLGQLLTVTSDMEKTLKIKTIQQLMKLVKLPNFLSTTELDLILGNYFKGFILQTTKKDVILQEIINGLVDCMQESTSVTNSTIELIINPLLNALQDDNVEQYEFILSLVGDLCVNYQVLEVISIRLLNKLPVINSSTNKFQLYRIIIELFIKLINQIEKIQQFLTNSWYKNFIPKFLNNVLTIIPVRSAEEGAHFDVIELTGDLLALIVKFIDVGKHQGILDEAVGVFFANEAGYGSFAYPLNLLEAPSFYINIFSKLLSCIDKTCVVENYKPIIPKVLQIVSGLKDERSLRIQYLLCLSLLFNKVVTDQEFIEVNLKLPLPSDDDLSEDFLIQFEEYIWILKGLIVKLDGLGMTSLDELLGVFASTDSLALKRLISKSLHILFIDLKIFTNSTPDIKQAKIISKVKNLNIKLLYKQQIFVKILPYLIDSEADFDIKFYGLSLVIENLSTNILINNLKEILPIVLKSFQNPELNKKSSLLILSIILKENESVLSPDDVLSLIPILVKLATTSKLEPIRVSSLTNLSLVVEKFPQLVKRNELLREIMPVLDDKKRTVRKLAIDLRQNLYEMK